MSRMDKSQQSSYCVSDADESSLNVSKSTSKKHNEFISEPLGEKEVTAVPGIGEVTGKKLARVGFEKAYMLLGQYLLVKKDNEVFIEWLVGEFGAARYHAANCATALCEWSKAFI